MPNNPPGSLVNGSFFPPSTFFKRLLTLLLPGNQYLGLPKRLLLVIPSAPSICQRRLRQRERGRESTGPLWVPNLGNPELMWHQWSGILISRSGLMIESTTPHTHFMVHPMQLFKIEVLIWVSFWRALRFQPFTWTVGSNPKRQSKNVEMQIQNPY